VLKSPARLGDQRLVIVSILVCIPLGFSSASRHIRVHVLTWRCRYEGMVFLFSLALVLGLVAPGAGSSCPRTTTWCTRCRRSIRSRDRSPSRPVRVLHDPRGHVRQVRHAGEQERRADLRSDASSDVVEHFRPAADLVGNARHPVGSTKMQVKDGRYLVLPALKNQPGTPPPWNHYKCYDAWDRRWTSRWCCKTSLGADAGRDEPQALLQPVEKIMPDGSPTHPLPGGASGVLRAPAAAADGGTGDGVRPVRYVGRIPSRAVLAVSAAVKLQAVPNQPESWGRLSPCTANELIRRREKRRSISDRLFFAGLRRRGYARIVH